MHPFTLTYPSIATLSLSVTASPQPEEGFPKVVPAHIRRVDAYPVTLLRVGNVEGDRNRFIKVIDSLVGGNTTISFGCCSSGSCCCSGSSFRRRGSCSGSGGSFRRRGSSSGSGSSFRKRGSRRRRFRSGRSSGSGRSRLRQEWRESVQGSVALRHHYRTFRYSCSRNGGESNRTTTRDNHLPENNRPSH